MDCWQARRLILLVLGCLLAPLDASAQPANAPAGEKYAWQFRALTVQIRATKSDAPDAQMEEEGYGFVVGKRGATLTIVTADHVVRDKDGIAYGKVTVDFFDTRNHPVPARLLSFRMPRETGDLAVLEIDRPGFPAFPQVPVARLPVSEGAAAWRIGKEEGWTPSNRPGAFVGRQRAIWLGFDNLDTPRGSSGGPILTDNGLIGMVTDDQSGRGLVLPVDLITDFLVEQGAPWDLGDPRKPSPAPAPTPPPAPAASPAPAPAPAPAPPPASVSTPADFKLSDYLGNWINAADTRGLTRISVRKDGDRLLVQVWGKCHPTDCDWGAVEGTPLRRSVAASADAPITAITATFSPGFAQKRLSLRVSAQGKLTATVDTHFTDGSGRADTETVDQFVPGPPSAPAPPPAPSSRPPTSPTPNFAGDWVEANPQHPDHPFRLRIEQNGNEITVFGSRMEIVNGVAKRTTPQGCGPQFQKPGYDYNGPNLAGPNTLSISLADSGATLIYEITVDWLAPCDGHAKGLDRTEYRLRRADSASLGQPARPTPPPPPPQAPSSGFIFPDSDRRVLSPDEVARLSPADLSIARNEIFARRGRIFDRPDLRAYFSRFPWYQPRASEVTLNAVESQNLKIILQAEQHR